MPIGIQRLNAKKSQPNPQIIFIKPLKGPDEQIAQDFLERIAAQCREFQDAPNPLTLFTLTSQSSSGDAQAPHPRYVTGRISSQ
jgi:hypothetical protein